MALARGSSSAGAGTKRTAACGPRQARHGCACVRSCARHDRPRVRLLRPVWTPVDAGEGIFARALHGKSAQVLGDPDLRHTYTYLGDLARGLVTLGLEDDAPGEIWHIPSAETISTRRFVELVFDSAGHVPKVSRVPPLALALGSLLNPRLRAVREQQYQRTAPWIVDHSKFKRAFGATTTPHFEVIVKTLDWFRRSASGEPEKSDHAPSSSPETQQVP